MISQKLPTKKFIEDIADARQDAESILIRGNVKNIALLGNLRALKKVELFTTTQEQLEHILPHLADIQELRMYEIRCTDLSCLGSLPKLEKLDLEWNTKIESLWDMSGNTSLRSLSVRDFSKLHDITALEALKNLEELHLSGGIWNKFYPDSLRPLRALTGLKKLSLTQVKIKDSSLLRPLAALKQLQELTLSNQHPTDEYARLSVALPNTKCDLFRPYVQIHPINGNDIMVVGSRKPFLNSSRDKERLEKYANEFQKLQEQFQTNAE